MKIGIALSGGGTRGMVHVGALQALEENDIFPDVISGTSAGSIVGALYAYGYAPKKILELSKENSFLKMLSLRLPSKGFVQHSFLRKQLQKQLPENNFDQLKKPFYVAISNLNTGLVEIKSEGPLWDYIAASCSVPIIFEPVEIENELYVDGGLMKNLPASILQGKVDVILGVNLVPQLRVDRSELSGMIGVAVRCFNLAALNNITPELRYCDVVIEPKEIHNYSRYRFSQMKDMYDIGYRETMEMMPDILKMVR
jgi:NTE family protein